MKYVSNGPQFAHLSLADLLRARDQFHPHLVSKRNVAGTAIGRYLRRRPGIDEDDERTLENSEVREDSWPCVLVFVDRWVKESEVGKTQELPLSDFVPKTIYLDDGKAVPICVVRAPRVLTPPPPLPAPPAYEGRGRLQGGSRVHARIQQVQHAATLGCLLTDGHKVYALTSRHVAGEEGTPLVTETGIAVGKTSKLQLGRVPFESVYAPWAGRQVFVNLDVALVEVEDLRVWSSGIRDIGPIGPMAALSTYNLSLNLIGAPVRAFGAASGLLEGHVAALFYRYKSVGGFDYVADFLIGSRDDVPLATRPGDSGAVWVIDLEDQQPAPLAVQWGGTVLGEARTTFALASNLSTIARELNVDVYRGPHVAAFEYWGTLGHGTVGTYAAKFVPQGNLRMLLDANSAHLGELANVPDHEWKGGVRPKENANHYSTMDLRRPGDNKTLRQLTPSAAALDLNVWREYYDDVGWHSDSQRGLLPFRVWQIFDELVGYIREGDVDWTVAAAGVRAHYIGDAAQPLHSSIYTHGNPWRDAEGNKQPMQGIFGDNWGSARGKWKKGVHSTYETSMLERRSKSLTKLLDKVPPATHGMPLVKSGRAAAWEAIELMDRARDRINPIEIVDTYAEAFAADSDGVRELWDRFGDETAATILDAARVLAMLWESAWEEGGGHHIAESELRDRHWEETLLPICLKHDRFLVSKSLDEIAL